MENLLSIKKKSFFPGLTLLLAGFLTGMLIPNFIYRFSWKQQAFSDSLDARWDFFPFSNLWFYCIWSPYGNYGDVFYRDWTGNRIFHVYSAVRTYRRRSCRSTSFSALSDLSAIMGFGVSDGLQGIYGNLAQSWNFSTESKRLSPESALIYSFIRCGNSFGMACKSMDFKQNSGFFEIF